ncbi:zinc knuckle domain-containing protein [Elysia marginata]|uniref:Zinc knuckle domain-containing protein n=1 Tax=Elysia marginata TaxID=1093978 RepID=A0AAV4HCZ1_9GAST|nr:zinc knuckle domain-containing protein [Elysia marginata]
MKEQEKSHLMRLDRLLQTLRSSYGEKRSVSLLLGFFQGTRQRRVEDSRAFSHRLREALLTRQRETEAQVVGPRLLRDHFAENLADAILRRQLRERVATSPEVTFLALRKMSVRLESDNPLDLHEEKAFSRQVAATGETLAAMKLLAEQVTKLTSLVAEGRSQPAAPRRGVRCYICRKEGHIARYCPNGRKPQLQGKRGNAKPLLELVEL